MIKTKFNIKGMHCRSCEALIQDELEELGIKAEVSYVKGEANVEFDDSKISLHKIKQKVRDEGYDVK